jgi:hypothetical protein
MDKALKRKAPGIKPAIAAMPERLILTGVFGVGYSSIENMPDKTAREIAQGHAEAKHARAKKQSFQALTAGNTMPHMVVVATHRWLRSKSQVKGTRACKLDYTHFKI